MTREEMSRNLENVYELYKDRPVHTFEIDIASMVKDVISFINENMIESIDRPTAHWKDGRWCSNCGEGIPTYVWDGGVGKKEVHFCIRCGARMESDIDGSN